ncbi:MAG: DUF2182 domain-containing protein [Proteobacteria bacterium]|nr:DUF2182 domain-containing protein [Pseudomonadota bacterium]
MLVLGALGWTYFSLLVAGMSARGAVRGLGPGMALFDYFGWPTRLDSLALSIFDALCRPAFADAAFAVNAVAVELGLIFLMWCAMVLVMMLPTAAPMILVYTDLAETAARRGENVASPLVLIAGFIGVWFGFCAVAAVLQVALARAALLDAGMVSASAPVSGAIFLAAGLYQFSTLKLACVRHCQRPFPFFFANWSARGRDIFRLGVRQGFYCLGCCWAAAIIMFAVGAMNVIWMAGLGLAMAVEKFATTARPSRVFGVIFLTIGVGLVAPSIASHWPRW